MPKDTSTPPPASSPEARRRMKRTGRRDTACELAIRRLLFAGGRRYRVDHPLPFDRRRRADLLFKGQRVAVFVDGCFWHGCPLHGTTPRNNARWWRNKIENNRQRDLDTNERLALHGWVSIRIWEHEDPLRAVKKINELLDSRRP